nr:hypothetical protein [Bacillaceae bacterium]
MTIGTEKMRRSCLPFAAMDGCRRKTVLPSAVFFPCETEFFKNINKKEHLLQKDIEQRLGIG